jgi:ABC-type lipoprotein export system ATPase subunit/GNAT superfamily N-acetyltransferase
MLPSRTACQAAHRLGITLDQLTLAPRSATPDIPLTPGARILITGPSGSGKTRLLTSVEKACISRGILPIRPTDRLPPYKPALDVFSPRLPIEHAMHALARAGLADAAVMVRRVHELSAGQIERLRLARAILECARAAPSTAPQHNPTNALLLDEFGSTLDDTTLEGVARLLRAHSIKSGHTAIVIATHRTAARHAFDPTLSIALNDAGEATITAHDTHSSRNAAHTFPISPGTRNDLHQLAHHHYRTRPPATIDRVFRAVDPRTNKPVAVLTLSLPTLNAAWRKLAWPGRYDTTDKRANAQRLNRELRCISRVIVAPPYRGLGIARALVSHALAHSPTPCVEALAALGRASPVFAAAGMTEYPVPHSAHDARLLDLLHEAEIEPWRLATPAAALARATSALSPHLLDRELRHWANMSRPTRTARAAPTHSLFTKACERLARTTHAYAWTRTT